MSEAAASLPGVILAGLLLTAAVLSLTTNWRLRFAVLAVQYGLTAALMAPVVIWQVAVVQAAVGLLVVGLLWVTSRELAVNREPAMGAPAGRLGLAALGRIQFQTNLPFRTAAVLLGTVAAWIFVTQNGLAVPGLALSLNLAGASLIMLSLISLGLTEEPMNTGIALLMLLTGFELVYAPVERSLTVAGLLAALKFGVALAVSHLVWLRYSGSGPGSVR